MKNKFLITGLATATLLSTAALTQLSPSVYAAEPTTEQPNATEKQKQDEVLANFDKALAETIKELEEEAKNDPDSADNIKATIEKLKEEAAKEKAKIVEGFNTGKTAEATENEINEIAKEEEAAEEEAAKAEEAAQKEFLANFDKALEDAIAELKKADTQNDPELAKKVEAAITNLKAEAAKQKKEIEDGFKNGLTVEEAEKAIDDANKKAAEEAKAEAEAKAAQDEFLANYDKALEEAVKELEKAETKSPEEAKAKTDTIAALKAASDATRKEIVEGFEKGLTVKEAEKLIDDLNKKAAEEDKEAAAKEKAAQDEFLANYDAALKAAIAELEKAETNSPEEKKAKADTIAALKAASDATRKEIVEGFEKGLTVKEAEKLIDKANEKAAEEDKEAAAKEKAAQDEFLANYDKALEEAVKELEKAETNSPEEAKAKADTIAALKAASDTTRKQIVEGFEKGLTAKQAEALIDDLNKKAAEEDKEAAAKEKAAQDEFLANYDAALKAAIAELEKAETNSPEEAKADTIAALKAASDATRNQIVEGFKKGLTAKQAEALIDELNKKAAEEDKEAAAKETTKPAEQPKSDKVESSNGQEAPVNEVPEFDLSTLETATGTQTQASPTQSTQAANAQAQEAPSTKNPSGINPRTSANSAQTATNETPAEKTAEEPAVAAPVAEAPKAQESAKQELPNTGSAEFAVFTPAVLSILAGLGLVAPKGKKEDK